MGSLKATFENFIARAYRVSEVLITGCPSEIKIEESINSFDVNSDESVGNCTELIDNHGILVPAYMGSSIADKTTKNILDSSLAARDRIPNISHSNELLPVESPLIGLDLRGSKRLRDDQDDIDLSANESCGPCKYSRSALKSSAFSSTNLDIPLSPIILSLDKRIRMQREDDLKFKTELAQEIIRSNRRMARITKIAISEQRIRFLKKYPDILESSEKNERELQALLREELPAFDKFD